MKKILIILLMLIGISVNAAVHYVAIGGGGSGTIGDPFGSIAQVNAHVFAPDDQVLFKKGDTFYGTIIPSPNATLGHPIIYGTYGTGANPIITGFTTISGWTDEGGGVYSKVITSEAQTNMVTVDGVNTPIGRYPNSTYLTYESRVTNVSITDTGLTGTPDWTGSEIAIRKNDWTLDRCLVTNQSTTILTYTNLGSASNADAKGYFFQNSLQTLDVLGEWYHNTSNGKFYMYFGAVNPTTKTVKVATLNNLVYSYTTASQFITIDGITFAGSISSVIKAYETAASIWERQDGWTIKNSTISFAGNGIRILGQNCAIDNNTISDVIGTAIRFSEGNSTITNNTLTNIGMIEGQSLFGYSAIFCADDTYTITDNSLTNVGSAGIYPIYSNNVTIQRNFIDNAVAVLNDAGGIYIDGLHSNVLIDSNVVINCHGNANGCYWPDLLAEGIYLDEDAGGITVSNNTVANCSNSGIKLHTVNNNTITNNTIYNNGTQLLVLDRVAGSLTTMSGNQFISKTSTQPCMNITLASNTLSTYFASNNNYFARPISDNLTIQTSINSGSSTSNISLATWKTTSTQEADSKKSFQSITNPNDYQFEYNGTSTAKEVTLTKRMIDVKGNKYNGKITLQPYTSLVLIRDLSAPKFLIFGGKTYKF